MIRSLLFATVLAFSLTAAGADVPIQFGVYKLKGTNPDGMKKYDGKIVMQREGTNYRVTWFIGPVQSQMGIGILENNVLSIGYMDLSGQDFGVVSLKVVNNKNLKGKWTSLFSKGGFGEEEFIFESEKVPSNLTPKAPKRKPEETSI